MTVAGAGPAILAVAGVTLTGSGRCAKMWA